MCNTTIEEVRQIIYGNASIFGKQIPDNTHMVVSVRNDSNIKQKTNFKCDLPRYTKYMKTFKFPSKIHV